VQHVVPIAATAVVVLVICAVFGLVWFWRVEVLLIVINIIKIYLI